jgi:hypothetical protein
MAMFGSAGPLDPGMSIPDDPAIRATANGPSRPSGMFGGAFAPGGVGRNIAGAIGDMLMQRAGGQPMFSPMMRQQRQAQLQMQHIKAQQDAEYERQIALAQVQAQLKLQYPDGEFATELRQGGVQPGTPEWTQAMHTKAQNALDPVVMTPQGPMLRSMILNGGGGQPAPHGITFEPVDAPGGQTPPASDNFRY